MTVKEFLDRYDNKEEFNEAECKDLFWEDLDGDEEIELIEEYNDENRRWSYMTHRYYKVRDRYFCFSADMGLTEYQEDKYWVQPWEVTLTVETKITTVNCWRRKEK